MTCYDRMLRSAEKCLDPETPASEDSDQPRAELDRQCLRFFISLLDHDLRGSLFESAVVGFLAVLGIDRDKNVLKEAYHYTPTLSGFIKISQLVVLQEAVIATEEGTRAQPADLLDDMRDRFMVHGTRSPFSWASRLRTYGKQVRDSTTYLGYIAWIEDAESVSYKDLQAFGMAQFRKFVKSQIESAQSQLEGLLLLHPEEQREDLAIDTRMHRINDNAAENRYGWSFLQSKHNLKSQLPNRQKWLLDRVLQNERLREEFVTVERAKTVAWNVIAVRNYKSMVDSFLERLLLLIHLTSGQPAR